MEKAKGQDHYLIIDWKYAILMITLILSVGLTIWSVSMNYVQRQEIYSLRVQMSNLTSNVDTDTSDLSDQYLDYYMDLSHKADISIDRVITVVIFLFGISTASGLFLAFRAPKDIEKSIDNANVSIASISKTVKFTKSQLDTQVQDARTSAKNAETSAEEARKATKDIEFQLWLHEATDEKNCVDKLDKLNNLIDKYPDEYFHYFERSQIANRKIEDVLRDLEFAKERGLPEFIYYNAIAAAYAQNGDNSKAIVNFDLSLEKEPNCGFVLANRGQCHCNIGETYLENKMFDDALSEFQLAIGDLNSAECNGEKTALVYIWRAYSSLGIFSASDSERGTCLESFDADREKAYEIDKDYTRMIVSKHDLKRHIQEDQSDRFLIADLYKSISSIYEFSNNPIDAFRSLVKTHNTLRVVGYDEIDEDALVQKIINMLLKHPEIYNEHAFPVSNSRLISAVLNSAYEAYTTREISKACCLFAACVKLCSDSGLRDDAINNLLFMVRRKETAFEVNYSVELFESATDKTSLILVINYVLYLLSRDTGETEYGEVLKLISTARRDQKSIMTVVGWWKELQFVGEDESERVMRILSDSGLYSLESNSVISDSSV